MKVYYARTSTEQQEGFNYELDEKKKEYDLVVFDKGVSGSTEFSSRSGGKRILELLENNQLTSFTTQEFSRIGRTIGNTISVLELFVEKGVNVRIEGLGVDSMVNDKPNPSWKIISTVMSLCADLERTLLLERIAEGKRVARSKGVKFGRSVGSNETTMKFMSKPKSIKIREYLEKGYKYEEIIKIVGTSNSTISKVNKYRHIFREYKKKGVHPNQLDLMVESEKLEKQQKPQPQPKVEVSKEDYNEMMANALENERLKWIKEIKVVEPKEVKGMGELMAEMLKENQKDLES